jgi:hypothetical protein
MQQQSAALTIAIQALTTQQSVAMTLSLRMKHSIEFPMWNGDSSHLPDFFFGIDTMTNDTFFQGCNWDRAVAGFKVHNNYLLAQIMDKIPLKYRAVPTEDPLIQNDGFVMLTKILQSLHPDTIEQKLLAISALAALEFSTTDTTASCMAKICGLANSL